MHRLVTNHISRFCTLHTLACHDSVTFMHVLVFMLYSNVHICVMFVHMRHDDSLGKSLNSTIARRRAPHKAADLASCIVGCSLGQHARAHMSLLSDPQKPSAPKMLCCSHI